MMRSSNQEKQSAPRTEADWMGSWFPITEAEGEFPYIVYGKLSPGGDAPAWSTMPHAVYDGIGAFAELLRRGGIAFGEIPQIADPRRPTPAQEAAAALRYFATANRRTRWRSVARARRGRPVGAAWYACSVEETEAVRAAAKAAGATVNSFLLAKLHPVIRSRYLAGGLRARGELWVIPVNMRGVVETHADTANQATNLFVEAEGDPTPAALQAQIERSMGDFTHWGGLRTLVLLGERLGLGFVARLLKFFSLTHVSWIGTFSNLGVWSGSPAQPGEAWLFSPPVLHWNPVAAGCVTYNGRLSLMVQLHPCISVEAEDARLCLDAWLRSIGATGRANLVRW